MRCVGIIMEIHINNIILFSLRNSGSWNRRLFRAAEEKSVYICRVQRLAILPQSFVVFFCIRANSEVGSNFQSFYGISCSHSILNSSESNPLFKKLPNYFFSDFAFSFNQHVKFPCHVSRNPFTPSQQLCIFVLLLSEGRAGEAWGSSTK
jgi:hypothetical protein